MSSARAYERGIIGAIYEAIRIRVELKDRSNLELIPLTKLSERREGLFGCAAQNSNDRPAPWPRAPRLASRHLHHDGSDSNSIGAESHCQT